MESSIYHESADVSLSAYIHEKLTAATPQYSIERCIYRVSNQLRGINNQSFRPLLVSIGPLHHNVKKLLPMESHKLKYLLSFFGDTLANPERLYLCEDIVQGWETEIRKCYADPISLPSYVFNRMVLIDGIFIIQFFWILYRSKSPSREVVLEDDYILNRPFLCNAVLRDLQLEENQLPFFILEELYRQIAWNTAPSFMEIVCQGLGVIVDESRSYVHLLHVVASNGLPSGSTTPTNTNNRAGKIRTIADLIFPPATQLHEAGVKFQVIKNPFSLLLIEFDNVKGILKIPEIQVSDNTEYLARNLIAFEQCHYGNTDVRYFTDYYFFLNWLINTPEDVQLLVNAGIIQNLMGSPEQVSDLINSLDTHAFTSRGGYYYENISLQLQSHCKKRWNRYRATLMHTYFNHPWAAISVAYAIVLLLLTILQVVAGIMAIPK